MLSDLKNEISVMEHSELYDFSKWFNNYLNETLKFRKKYSPTKNMLKNKIINIDIDENYRDLYKFSIWFKNHKSRRSFVTYK